MKYWKLTLALMALVPPVSAAELPTLEAALRDKAEEILKLARERGAKSIGVLKFLVRVGDQPESDNVGTLNLALANRLTVALILACKDEEIGIVSNANEVLANRSANHLDAEGRIRCFRARGFSLAWGDPEIFVKPDLFITGRAHLSPNLESTVLRFEAFGDDGQIDTSLGEIRVKTTVQTLIDTGHSYLITRKTHPELFRGARGGEDSDLDGPAVNLSQRYSAHLTTTPDDSLPDLDSDAPIRVRVFYGDEPVSVKRGEVREPQAGQKVWFRLENLSDEVHGVVLKVNGENSIFRERLPDAECHKWILKPGGSVNVRGFQTSLGQREDFIVQTPEESRANEIRYGEHAGTFQITVFRARSADSPATPRNNPNPPSPPPSATVAEPQEAMAAIARGVVKPEGIRPADLKSLQRELRRRNKALEGARGLVDADTNNPQPHPVEKVTFEPDPKIPVMTYTIRYYKPGGNK